jgi:hypothetical protein
MLFVSLVFSLALVDLLIWLSFTPLYLLISLNLFSASHFLFLLFCSSFGLSQLCCFTQSWYYYFLSFYFSLSVTSVISLISVVR